MPPISLEQMSDKALRELIYDARAEQEYRRKSMSDNKTKRDAPDNKLVALQEDYEVRHWCEVLDCDEDRLRAAVEAVGHSADAVRTWLASPLTQPIEPEGGVGDRADMAAGGEPPDV